MKLITFRSQLEEEIRRLDSMVLRLNPKSTRDRRMHRHLEVLRSLDPETITPEKVDDAVGPGYQYVHRCTCNECDQLSDVVVELGEEPDYEAGTAWICLGCLRRAVSLAESTSSSLQESKDDA